MNQFTTYFIPEEPEIKTGITGKWLGFLTREPVSSSESGLLEKIASALKADFSGEVWLWEMRTGSSFSGADLPSAMRLIISFGVLPDAAGLWIDMTRPGIRILESVSFILTLPVKELAASGEAKKELWKNMQIWQEHNNTPR